MTYNTVLNGKYIADPEEVNEVASDLIRHCLMEGSNAFSGIEPDPEMITTTGRVLVALTDDHETVAAIIKEAVKQGSEMTKNMAAPDLTTTHRLTMKLCRVN